MGESGLMQDKERNQFAKIKSAYEPWTFVDAEAKSDCNGDAPKSYKRKGIKHSSKHVQSRKKKK